MSKLKVIDLGNIRESIEKGESVYYEYYPKSEADKVIAEKDAEIAKLQAMLEERNKQVGKLKDSIAPKQSDKTLQERLNEVCEKHGVSTLQDLDWAFCKSEKRRARDCIAAAKRLRHNKYKRCLDMAKICKGEAEINHNSAYEASEYLPSQEDYFRRKAEHYERWQKRWLGLAEEFKEAR